MFSTFYVVAHARVTMAPQADHKGELAFPNRTNCQTKVFKIKIFTKKKSQASSSTALLDLIIAKKQYCHQNDSLLQKGGEAASISPFIDYHSTTALYKRS